MGCDNRILLDVCSALALLAKIGFRSKNHAATILVLEEFFVNKKLLDKKTLLMLENSFFQKEEVEKLSDARQKREIAQYSITKQTTKEMAGQKGMSLADFVRTKLFQRTEVEDGIKQQSY